MSGATNIEWADCVWNPVVGCSPVSEGCRFCYAATMARRLQGMGKPGYEPRQAEDTRTVMQIQREEQLGYAAATRVKDRGGTVRIAEVRNGRAVFTGDVRLLEDRLAEPLGWRKPRRIFVCSMSDLCHEAVPFDYIDRVFAVAALCPQHQFLVLTKRPERMAEWFDSARRRRIEDAAMDMLRDYDRAGCIDRAAWPLPNVWLGTSCEDQTRADERIPHLLRCPAAVRWLSCEPLLGPIDLREWMWGTCLQHDERVGGAGVCQGHTWREDWLRCLHWIVVGGESGHNARPCRIEWIRSLVEQCRESNSDDDRDGLRCFVKQVGACIQSHVSEPHFGKGRTEAEHGGITRWFTDDRKGGDPDEWPDDLRVREWPEVTR